MGWAGFKELYGRKDRFNIRILARDSARNRKKLARYVDDPAVTVIWGDLMRYEDVLEGVNGSDYVLHVGGMVSPAADYYPEKTLKVNIGSAEKLAIFCIGIAVPKLFCSGKAVRVTVNNRNDVPKLLCLVGEEVFAVNVAATSTLSNNSNVKFLSHFNNSFQV